MIIGYWIVLNGKKYCYSNDRAQAENIARALIAEQNKIQNDNNLFFNFSVQIVRAK